MFSFLFCFPPFSLIPHTTLLSETRLAYSIIFFPVVFFLSSVTLISRLSPLSRPMWPIQFFFSLQIKSIKLLFLVLFLVRSSFVFMSRSPADLFYPPQYPHLKSFQSPLLSFSCMSRFQLNREPHSILSIWWYFSFLCLYSNICLTTPSSDLLCLAFLAKPILVLISVSHLLSLVMRANIGPKSVVHNVRPATGSLVARGV